MSAWYVWSAMGLYPETPGTAGLALGSPLFPQVAIAPGTSHTITVNAPAAADNAPYVQSLNLNGAAWSKAYPPASGATLDFTLGTAANTSWASAGSAAPPSYDGTATPFPAEASGPIDSGITGKCIDDAGSSTSNGSHIRASSGSSISRPGRRHRPARPARRPADGRTRLPPRHGIRPRFPDGEACWYPHARVGREVLGCGAGPGGGSSPGLPYWRRAAGPQAAARGAPPGAARRARRRPRPPRPPGHRRRGAAPPGTRMSLSSPGKRPNGGCAYGPGPW
jgi:hypothetical protein